MKLNEKNIYLATIFPKKCTALNKDTIKFTYGKNIARLRKKL